MSNKKEELEKQESPSQKKSNDEPDRDVKAPPIEWAINTYDPRKEKVRPIVNERDKAV